MDKTDVLLVLVTVPDRRTAEQIAAKLVEDRLAACVNVVDNLTSFYRWDDKLNRDQELLLMIKTTKKVFESLKETIISIHPYDLPEIIGIEVTDGLEGYLRWVLNEVGIR